MRASLNDYLKLAAPHLLPSLISPEALRHISAIAGQLPPVSATGFECRLGEKAPRADFGVRFLHANGDAEILGGFATAESTLPEFFLADPVWQRISAFGARWARDSLLRETIHDIFFEFDVDGAPKEIPIPSFFLEFTRASQRRLEALEVALGILWGGEMSAPVTQQWARCLDALPPEGLLCSVGAMFSREFDGVRLGFQGLAPSEIPHFLARIGWPGHVHEIEAIVKWLPMRLALCIDVGETVLPKVGLECLIDGSLKQTMPKWTEFLNTLVDKNVCLAEKRDALLEWFGYTHARANPAVWPENLRRLAATRGPNALGVFVRTLNHIKLSYQPDRPIEAKAYLSLLQSWLKYDQAAQRYALGDLPGQDSATA